MLLRLPGVVLRAIALPLDQVLSFGDLVGLSVSVTEDLLYLILHLTLNHDRWGWWKW